MNNAKYAPKGRQELAQAKAANKSAQITTFEVGGNTVKLSPQLVHDYLVTGDKEKVTMQEVVMFINLCKFSGLNPWLREAYCIKYGSEPATMVVGKSAFEKRAESNPNYDGFKAGTIVLDEEVGELSYRDGSFRLPGETLVGGWAEVFRKDRTQSVRIEVSFDEYAGRRRDGSLNGQWSKKPGTMIRKVALVQALREAFPTTYTGMYDAAEMGVDDTVLDMQPVDMEEAENALAPQQTTTFADAMKDQKALASAPATGEVVDEEEVVNINDL